MMITVFPNRPLILEGYGSDAYAVVTFDPAQGFSLVACESEQDLEILLGGGARPVCIANEQTEESAA